MKESSKAIITLTFMLQVEREENETLEEFEDRVDQMMYPHLDNGDHPLDVEIEFV